eukprot:scaffold126491_cov54-Phaeocystis_antarctica.AAC.2
MLALASCFSSALVPQLPATRRSTVQRCSAPVCAEHTRLAVPAVLAGLTAAMLPAMAWADSVTEAASSAVLQVPSSLLALDPEDQQLLLVLVGGSVACRKHGLYRRPARPKAADWPRHGDCQRHDLGLKGASGPPAGRSLSHLVIDPPNPNPKKP